MEGDTTGDGEDFALCSQESPPPWPSLTRGEQADPDWEEMARTLIVRP
jgi:hypothetical protein